MVINFVEITDSTQVLAKNAIQNNQITDSICVFVAKEQTSGNGRNGKQWVSPAGNLYGSIVFANNIINNPDVLSITTAVAVDNSLQTEKHVEYKWPNDLLINGKKFAGILIEKILDFTIVGIGINLSNHPQNIEYPATNLKAENLFQSQVNNELLIDLITKISDQIITFDKMSNIADFWNNKAYKINQVISVELFDKTIVTGIFAGIDNSGNLLLKHNDKIDVIINGRILF